MTRFIPGWHPAVVHFPLALVIAATGLFGAAWLLPRSRWAPTCALVGTWNLCLGAIAILIALATGLGAAMALQVDAAAHVAVGTHLKWALFASLCLLPLAIVRGVGSAPQERPSTPFMLALLLATAMLVVTGYYGARNVYLHGVGVVSHVREMSVP